MLIKLHINFLKCAQKIFFTPNVRKFEFRGVCNVTFLLIFLASVKFRIFEVEESFHAKKVKLVTKEASI